MPPKIISLASGTDPGQLRDLNEDRVLVFNRSADKGTPLAFLMVADGMGGHQAGDIASTLATETVFEDIRWFLERHETEDTQPLTPVKPDNPVPDLSIYAQRLELAIQHANQVIYQYSLDNPREAGNLGTTITCALVKEGQAIIANVGDSRTYILRQGELNQATNDHSYVGHLLQIGEISKEDVFDHPQRSLITRSLGNKPLIEIDIFQQPINEGDQLLLCSDGLWEMVRDESAIAKIMDGSDSAETTVQRLINLANSNGGEDNIGIAVAKIS